MHLIDRSAIYRGEALTLLPRIRPQSVRLLLTDPPYNVSRANNLHTMGRRSINFGSWDKTFDQTTWLRLGVDTLMPGGSIVIFNAWKNLGHIADDLTSLGMEVKRMLRWRKSNPFPRNIGRSFVQDAEYALWAVKPGGHWVFNKRDSVSYERGEFEYPVVRGSLHPTKKPTELFRTLIEILSNPNELVLDPFVGSGTTSIAAQMCGRKHIAFELDPAYFELAAKELSQHISTKRLRAV